VAGQGSKLSVADDNESAGDGGNPHRENGILKLTELVSKIEFAPGLLNALSAIPPASNLNGPAIGSSVAALASAPVQEFPGQAAVSQIIVGPSAPQSGTPGRSGNLGGSFVNLTSPLAPSLDSAGVVFASQSAVPSLGDEADPSQVHQARPSSTPAAKPDAPIIDWQSSTISPLDQRNTASPKATSEWLDDFLNHLGKTQVQRNPNAGIRVRPTGAIG
jgi:hypothetical protein